MATLSDAERLVLLEREVRDLREDLNKLNGIATNVAILTKEMAEVKARSNWIIGLLGTFTVALLIASLTYALNAFGGGTG